MMLRLLIIFTLTALSLNGFSQEPKYHMSIYFGGGSNYISESQRSEIKTFLELINNVEQYDITIHSYTDNIGGEEFNEWLSKMRSQSTIKQLLLNNIDHEMIEIKDFGLHNPVYDNSTWEGKLKNRRVDILLWPLIL